jgi:hypothetical protein
METVLPPYFTLFAGLKVISVLIAGNSAEIQAKYSWKSKNSGACFSALFYKIYARYSDVREGFKSYVPIFGCNRADASGFHHNFENKKIQVSVNLLYS